MRRILAGGIAGGMVGTAIAVGFVGLFVHDGFVVPALIGLLCGYGGSTAGVWAVTR